MSVGSTSVASDSTKQCNSSSVLNGNDSLEALFATLKAYAKEKGFVIHEVERDGDCLFSSVTYQLQSIVNKSELRRMVANYLESHSHFYQDFMHQPIASNDPYNADTEAPTAEDAYIDTIVDPVASLGQIFETIKEWCLG